MPTKINLKFSGLNTNSNSIGSVPEGALTIAKNVVIDKDDVLESRRGFKLYGDTLENLSDRAKQLLNYKDTLIRHYSDILEYDDLLALGTFTKYKELSWNYSSTLTRVLTTATFTSIRPHGLVSGDEVVISGANQSEYNGTFAVIVTGANTFTYTVTGAPATPATGNPVIESKTAHIEEPDVNHKIHGVESVNGNFYFTSDTGIKKLDAINTYIQDTGAPEALDLDLDVTAATGNPILPQNSQLAYRVLWGYKDLNQNLILGAPSSRAVIGLDVSDLIIPDFNSLLMKIDAAAAVNTGTLNQTNYYSTLNIPTTSTANALNGALKALASKLELDMNYVNPTGARYGRSSSITNIPVLATPGTLTITSNAHNLANNDSIVIANSNSIPSIDGEYAISNRTANTFDIVVAFSITVAGTSGTWTSGVSRNYPTPTTDETQDFLDQQAFFDEIVDLLLDEPIANITVVAQTAGNFQNSTQGENVELTFTVPEKITTKHFYQIYRTAPALASNIDPGDDMGLVFESNPTDAEIKAGLIVVVDETLEDFRGTDLYTSPRQEGILQANSQPPFAKDIALFKNINFFANTKTTHKATLNLLGITGLSGTKISIADVVYTFAASENASIGQVQVFTDGTPAQNVDATARSLVRVINRYTNNTMVYAFYLSSPDDVPGQMLIKARSLAQDKFYILSNSPTIGSTNFNPSIAPENNVITGNTVANPTVVTTTTSHQLVTGDQVYISFSNSTPSITGVWTATRISDTSFSVPVNVTIAGTTGYFKKASLALGSDNEQIKNRIYYSKQNENEAVPIVNFFNVGSGDKEILRIVPLRDSLFVLKTDGIYRIVGEETDSLILSLFDNTTEIKGTETVAVGNNQIYAFSSQGVVVISDTGVQIVSRPIEDQLLNVAHFDNLNSTAVATFYQTDRKYILFLPLEEDDTVSQHAFVYNNITQAWVEWTISKTCALVNTKDDKLYFGASDTNSLEVERKTFTRADFADRQYDINVTVFDPDTMTVTLSNVDNVNEGDVLVQTQSHTNAYTTYDIEVEAKVLSVDPSTSSVVVSGLYDYEVGPIVNFASYECKVRWAPVDGGNEGEIKHFREATLRFKKSRITTPVLGFSSDIQQGLETIDLIGPGLGNWGYFKWGKIPWGGDPRQRGFRTYIPIKKQRCSLLNCEYSHQVAREDWQAEGLTLVFEQISPRIND